MKRRVYHLAALASISPETALASLQDAGYRVNSINDLLPAHARDAALQLLQPQMSSQVPKTVSPSYFQSAGENSSLTYEVSPKSSATATTHEDIPVTTNEAAYRRLMVQHAHPQPRKGKQPQIGYGLNTHELLAIHDALVAMFAEENDPIFPPGPRDIGLLESAVQRPSTGHGDKDKYTTIHAKSAALFHSLVKNHPFHNGNKRTALVALVVYLDRNRLLLEASDEELFRFVVDTASTPHASGGADEEVATIEAWLREHTIRVDDQAHDMEVDSFLSAIEKAGGRYRPGGGGSSWIVWGLNPQGSISISKSTPRLSGAVVKTFLQKLGLSYNQCGIHLAEFESGLDPNQSLIRKFRNVLRQLSHA